MLVYAETPGDIRDMGSCMGFHSVVAPSQLYPPGSHLHNLGTFQAIATHYWDPKTMRALRIFMCVQGKMENGVRIGCTDSISRK